MTGADPGPPPAGSGVLVLRTWWQDDDVCARLIGSLVSQDPRAGTDVVVVAAGVDDICAAVRAWVISAGG